MDIAIETVIDKIIPQYEQFYKLLNKKQKDVLKRYKHFTYQQINALLANKTMPDLPEITFNEIQKINAKNEQQLKIFLTKRTINDIKVLLHLFNNFSQKIPLCKDVYYKGIHYDNLESKLKKLQKNDTLDMTTFVSTSINELIAKEFAKNSIMVIKSDINLPCIYLPWELDNISHNFIVHDEFEMLLPPISLKFIKSKTKKVKSYALNKTFSHAVDKTIKYYYFEVIKRLDIQPIKYNKKIMNTIKGVRITH